MTSAQDVQSARCPVRELAIRELSLRLTLLVSSYLFLFFEHVIDNVCGCLSFELVMMKVMPYDPSHEEIYNAFIMKT